jgi:hypothetical protein
MEEGCGRAKLLTVWWLGTREREGNRKSLGIKCISSGHTPSDLHPPSEPHLLLSNASQNGTPSWEISLQLMPLQETFHIQALTMAK